jgi:hypothetical protein
MIWELVKFGGIKSIQSGDLRAKRDPWELGGAVIIVVLQCHPLMFTNAGGITEDRFHGLEDDAVRHPCENVVESEHYLALLGL